MLNAAYLGVRFEKNMDSASYREQCSLPSSFTRKELEDTLEALKLANSEATGMVETVLNSEPIQKPKKHAGGEESDYFNVVMSDQEAEAIVEELGALEVQSVSAEGNTTPLASHYALLLDRWLRYSGVSQSAKQT